MKSRTDRELLGEYVERDTQAAFAELVRRYIDLVYSVAIRMVMNRQHAEDVTQAVFVVLACQARQLTERPVLSGWLHRTTQNLAAKIVRTEVRRRAREQEAATMQLDTPGTEPAWEQIAPFLDDAISQLSDTDRDALTLRFFERKTARDLGERLGLSEEAAQKRVTRALERLRSVFAKHGLLIPSTALAGAISLQAVQAAPVGLAATVIASISVAATTGTSTLGILKLMASTKLKVCLASLVAAGMAGTIVLQHQTNDKLQSELASLQSQLAEAKSAPAPVMQGDTDELARLRAEHSELLRLRGEAGRLRQNQAEVARLESDNARLRASQQSSREPLPEQVDEASEVFKTIGIARMNYVTGWFYAFISFAQKNGLKIPETFEQAAEFYPDKWASVMSAFDQNKFEIVYRGSLEDISETARTIIVREKAPFANPSKTGYLRTYLFADGHSEIHSSPDGNFEAWEKDRLAATPHP
ncbi:MAG: sigma-70 family RNA polymerase sigma factor [Verrucomicrobiota bacterium]